MSSPDFGGFLVSGQPNAGREPCDPVDREVCQAHRIDYHPITGQTFLDNEIDSHVVARLGRVDKAGIYHLLSLGTIRPACRKIDMQRRTATEIAIDIDVPEPLTSGESVTLKFSLTPQPVLLRAGERLRFDVASRTDLLRSDASA